MFYREILKNICPLRFELKQSIYDYIGKHYLDGCSGALISNIGHCIPQVTDAISQQLQELDFAHPSRWRNPTTEEAARALAEITPEI